MVVNHDLGLLNVLDKILASKHEFYLTGSRFFGNVKPSSDWDFFVEASDRPLLLEEELESMGLVMTENCYTGTSDVTICRVYSRSFIDPGTSKEIKIDVQVIHPSFFKLKCKAQKILKGIYGEMGLPEDKVLAKTIWRNTILTIRMLEAEHSEEIEEKQKTIDQLTQLMSDPA